MPVICCGALHHFQSRKLEMWLSRLSICASSFGEKPAHLPAALTANGHNSNKALAYLAPSQSVYHRHH